MDFQRRAIRALISSMSPNRATDYVKSFHLRQEEEAALLECDVHGLSYIQAADKLHLTPETIKRRRQKAFSKIADELNNTKT